MRQYMLVRSDGSAYTIKVDRVDNADQVQAKIAAFLAAEGIDLKLAEGENFADPLGDPRRVR